MKRVLPTHLNHLSFLLHPYYTYYTYHPYYTSIPLLLPHPSPNHPQYT